MPPGPYASRDSRRVLPVSTGAAGVQLAWSFTSPVPFHIRQSTIWSSMWTQAATSVLPWSAREPEVASPGVMTFAAVDCGGGPVVPVACKLSPIVASSPSVRSDSAGRPSAPAGA